MPAATISTMTVSAAMRAQVRSGRRRNAPIPAERDRDRATEQEQRCADQSRQGGYHEQRKPRRAAPRLDPGAPLDQPRDQERGEAREGDEARDREPARLEHVEVEPVGLDDGAADHRGPEHAPEHRTASSGEELPCRYVRGAVDGTEEHHSGVELRRVEK